MLVVKEGSGGFKGTGVWKLPTGVVGEVSRIASHFLSLLAVVLSFTMFFP